MKDIQNLNIQKSPLTGGDSKFIHDVKPSHIIQLYQRFS